MLARSAAARRRGLPASWRRAASTAPAASPLQGFFAWAAATPQLYFGDGLFGGTSCGLLLFAELYAVTRNATWLSRAEAAAAALQRNLVLT